MSKLFHLRQHWILTTLFFMIGIGVGIGRCGLGGAAVRAAEADRSLGVQGDRNRIMLAFRVNPEAVQRRLPTPWQLTPPTSGPLKGATLFVVLVDRLRDDEAESKPGFHGPNRIVNIAVPARYPQTDQMASIILGGWASNPANVPGFYQVYRQAAVRVEQVIKGEAEAEEVTDVWEVRDAVGHGGLELRRQSRRTIATRKRERGEAQARSAKDPDLWHRHRFDAATDMVRSVPEGIDMVQQYTFRLTAPEYRELFDGSEQLVGIVAAPWHIRQVLTP
jgi:hypothetical protein